MKKLLLCLMVLSLPAGAVTTKSVTVGTSSASCLDVNYTGNPGQIPGSAVGLLLVNQSATATITYAISSASLPTAATNAAGSVTIGPGQQQFIASAGLSSSYIACLASGASTPMTLVLF